jgi:hypothetical protein
MFLGMLRASNLFYLQEVQLHRVDLPKIVTITLSVFLSRFTSSTTPLKGERPLVDPHLLALLEHVLGFGFRPPSRTC